MRKLVISFDRNESFIVKMFRILSVIVAIISAFMAIFSNIEYSLWILPLTYAIGMFLLGNKNLIKFTPGIITLNIVMFMRYAVLPLIMYIDGSPMSKYSPQLDYMQEAIIVMWVELIVILATLFFTGLYYKNRYPLLESDNKPIQFNQMKYGSIICILGVGLCVAMIIRYPHLIGGMELLTQGYLSNEVDISSVSGVVGIIWKAWTIWLGIYFIYLIKQKNLKGGWLTFFILVGIGLIVLISFIGQTTISRWYSVVTFCAVYFCVIRIFPEKRVHVTRLTMIPAIILLLIVTIYKNTAYLDTEDGMLRYINEIFDVSTLNSYFAGPFNVNNAIHMKETHSLNLSSVFYDLLRNFPIINHYIDVSSSTVGAYANYLGRGDQILPIVGQSMIYFGYLFTPLLSIISIILVRFFDYKYLKSTSIDIYIYAFTACWIGLATILNFTICVSWFYVTIVPAFLLVKLTELTGMYRTGD